MRSSGNNKPARRPARGNSSALPDTELLAHDRIAVLTPASQKAADTGVLAGETGTELEAPQPERLIGLRDVRANEKVRAYIEMANEQMAAIGYSEHGLRHAAL
ncbi:MAG TPA: hypothetical protein VGS41_09330, partial [Chthonomonadales bacterium]|nr:hypothetical protein [Chthonomonadales bacterium]